MRVDPFLPRAEKLTLVLEAIGDGKVRVNHQALDRTIRLWRSWRSASSSMWGGRSERPSI
jgi:hypothetical protein